MSTHRIGVKFAAIDLKKIKTAKWQDKKTEFSLATWLVFASLVTYILSTIITKNTLFPTSNELLHPFAFT